MQDYVIIRTLSLQGQLSIFDNIFTPNIFVLYNKSLKAHSSNFPFSSKSDVQGNPGIPCSWQEGHECTLVQVNIFPQKREHFSDMSSYPLEAKRGEPMRWIAELEKSQDEGRIESLGKSSSGQVLTSDRNSLLYSVLQWLPFLDLKLLL